MTQYKAAAYLRLSYITVRGEKTGQAREPGYQESDSIGNQRKLIEDFVANQPDIELVSEQMDDGYSGILFDRPAFLAMMDDVKTGKINCIIVKDISRLGREHVETSRYLCRILPAYGVRFIAINDNIDTANVQSGDELTVLLKNILNDAYSHDISVKTRSALQTKRSQGDYVGACPIYGYRKDPENKNHLIVDKGAAQVIQEIYRRRLEGASAKKIAEVLNQRGVPSPLAHKINHGLPHPTGNFADSAHPKWSANTVLRILKDETYTGVLLQGRQGTYNLKEVIQRPATEWNRTENAHEAIISKHDFEPVRRIAKLDTRTSPHGDQVYPFSGILVCGCCGGRMTRKTNTVSGKKRIYYNCPTGKKNGCEHPVMLREEALTECVRTSLQAHIRNVISMEELLNGMGAQSLEMDATASFKAQLSEHKAQLEQAQECRASLYENFTRGILTKEEYRDHKKRFTSQIDEARDAIAQLHEQLETGGSDTKHFWTERYREFAGTGTLDRRTVISLI